MNQDTALRVENLQVVLGDLKAVRGVSFSVMKGERWGLVGESGAGKSLTALAIMELLPEGWSTSGSIWHEEVDLVTASDKTLSSYRGRTMSMIFQDPTTALNPVLKVGKQIMWVLRHHMNLDKKSAYAQSLELLVKMNLPRPESIMKSYPHQLSGGQRQRIMIAMAIACYPRLIIADEPTTALDVTIQKQVLRLLDQAVKERNCALLMITHDLPVIAAMCERVAVMYGGRIVESGEVSEVFTNPRHPYTKGLLASQPTMDNIDFERKVRLPSIRGSVPTLHDMPEGCAFRDRCDFATDKCQTLPELDEQNQQVACWYPLANSRIDE
jgi:peptide/nickel transport system ATP-binding protein